MKFDHLPQLVVDGSESEEYGDWVAKTAKLLKRPYIGVHRILEREKWSLTKIKDRYMQVTKHNHGTIPSDVLWWYLRKQDNKK